MLDEEENYCFYGKPLDAYDKDAFPKKRAITVEEQIATDAQGRRRFHGAFTGGFSAGFFNTVGSLEGWQPSEFKSSRNEKTARVSQNPTDFMDEEDLGEFGIAPERVKATKDFSSNKRKRTVLNDGPIPGEPVLHSLLTAGNETIGYLLLKNMGVGDKLKKSKEQTDSKVYGCEMPVNVENNEESDFEIPQLYLEFLSSPKTNTNGLGYSGLDKSHLNLFVSPNLIIQDKDKKLSIRGQAFGVGAFENDDGDIYEKEDLSNYDFVLTAEEEKPKPKTETKNKMIFNTFIKSNGGQVVKETFPPPVIPHSFTGKYKQKKSRFEPIQDSNNLPKKENQSRINVETRAEILGESIPAKPNTNMSSITVKKEREDSSKKKLNSFLTDKFVSAGKSNDVSDILKPVEKFQNDHGTEDQRNAVKMKMFGPLTRTTEDWNPCSLLCKRFNVPEPLFDKTMHKEDKKRAKNLIFEYQKHHEENLILQPGLQKTSSTEPLQNNEVSNNTPTTLPEVKLEPMDVTSESEINHQSDENSTKKDDNLSLDITEKLHTEDKLDLFKAVFSSSESEDEDDQNENIDDEKVRTEEMKANLLSKDLAFPKITPLKDGILSNIDFSKIPTSTKCDEKNEIIENAKEIDPNVYGPKVPDKLPQIILQNSEEEINMYKSSDSGDEWVEKDSDEKKSKKHKKLKKEHKHKKTKRKKVKKNKK